MADKKVEKQITQEEIIKLIRERNMTLAHVVDAVVDVNGIIGVGLITLGKTLRDYCYGHPQNRITKSTRQKARDL